MWKGERERESAEFFSVGQTKGAYNGRVNRGHVAVWRKSDLRGYVWDLDMWAVGEAKHI
jgi:hypothetical protein